MQALRGAPQLHTVHARLRVLRDLEVLRTLPALQHLTIIQEDEDFYTFEEEEWQESAVEELVLQALPSLEYLEFWGCDDCVSQDVL